MRLGSKFSLMAVPLVDIIIVNWNAGMAVHRCLESLSRSQFGSFKLDRLVVVDNASKDGSIDQARGLELPLVVLRNNQNLGFAAACNQGARESRAEYLLFLNPDTRLDSDALSVALTFMEQSQNQAVGICGGLAFNEYGGIALSAARFPTLKIIFGKISGLDRFFPSHYPSHQLSPEECQKGGVVDQVIGAFFLVRRELYQKLNGFDERFFVYFEEVDFSRRAQAEGFISYLIPQCHYIHIGCVSSNQKRGQRLFYFLRSRTLYAFKHFSRQDAWLLTILTLTLELMARLILSLASFSACRMTETVEGYYYLIRHFLRKGIQP
jgi:N-acetylglucosaminyl-diphospho-decaprenol L-rhamnosyltransferase